MNILVLFAFHKYPVCIRLVFFEVLSIYWYFQHPVQIDMRIFLVFLAQCPHTEIFFHSYKYLQYSNAFGNYMSTYQKHFCIWKIHFQGLLTVHFLQFEGHLGKYILIFREEPCCLYILRSLDIICIIMCYTKVQKIIFKGTSDNFGVIWVINLPEIDELLMPETMLIAAAEC